MFRSLFLALTLVFTLSACQFFGDKVDPQKSWTVEQFYKEAKDELNAGNNQAAIKLYEALEAKYPFGKYAQQSQLDIAYAQYRDGDTTQAAASCDKFIKLHPNHQNVDYALYLKGLAFFKPDFGILGSVFNLDQAERDPKALRESFDVFKDLVIRFPESRYVDDSRSRMGFLVNSLAKHDLAAARYYLERGAYLAAVNRAQNILQRYPQAPALEGALEVTVAGYEKMGMKDLAADNRRVLQKNFPANKSESATEKSAWWKVW